MQHKNGMLHIRFRKIAICRVSGIHTMFMLKTQFHDLLNTLKAFRLCQALHAISSKFIHKNMKEETERKSAV